MKYPVFFKVVGVVDVPDDKDFAEASAQLRRELYKSTEKQLCTIRTEGRVTAAPGADIVGESSVLFVIPCTQKELFEK